MNAMVSGEVISSSRLDVDKSGRNPRIIVFAQLKVSTSSQPPVITVGQIIRLRGTEEQFRRILAGKLPVAGQALTVSGVYRPDSATLEIDALGGQNEQNQSNG